MTKKEFIAIADAIRNDKDAVWTDKHIHTICDFLAGQNPNFDRERWMHYVYGKCGPNGGKIK